MKQTKKIKPILIAIIALAIAALYCTIAPMLFKDTIAFQVKETEYRVIATPTISVTEDVHKEELIADDIVPLTEPTETELGYVIYGVTDADIDLMARVVMSEASILNFDAKQAVAETIVNRVLHDSFPDNIHDVIYQANQFSTADNGKPNEDCYKAVINALSEPIYNETMVWFRTDYPHKYGYPYMVLGNTWFNTIDNTFLTGGENNED